MFKRDHSEGGGNDGALIKKVRYEDEQGSSSTGGALMEYEVKSGQLIASKKQEVNTNSHMYSRRSSVNDPLCHNMQSRFGELLHYKLLPCASLAMRRLSTPYLWIPVGSIWPLLDLTEISVRALLFIFQNTSVFFGAALSNFFFSPPSPLGCVWGLRQL